MDIHLEIPADVDIDARFVAGVALAAQHNIAVTGDSEIGTFSGPFAGSWFRLGNRLDVTITRMPIPFPAFLVRREITRFLTAG